MKNARENIRIRVMLDAKTFTDFSAFNTFNLNKGSKQPLLFMLIMFGFAIVCFISGRPQSGSMGAVLIVAGIALPAYYLLRFIGSTRTSIKAHGLPREAYELLLTDRTVEIQSLAKGGDSASIKWKDLHHAYRNVSCIYLYTMPQRAFLLPNGQADEASTEEVWNWLVTHMGSQKTNDIRKRKS